MTESGFIIYILLCILAPLFWAKMHGCSLQQLLDRSAREHHHVLKVLARHPRGGTWREFQRWMAEENE